MKTVTEPIVKTKRVLKEALAEAIEDKKDFFYQTFLEVIEDIGLSRAIEEGLHTGKVSEEEIMETLHAG